MEMKANIKEERILRTWHRKFKSEQEFHGQKKITDMVKLKAIEEKKTESAVTELKTFASEKKKKLY